MSTKLNHIIEAGVKEALQMAAHLSSSGNGEKSSHSFMTTIKKQQRIKRPDPQQNFWVITPNWFDP